MQFYEKFIPLQTNLDPISSKFETELSFNRFDPMLIDTKNKSATTDNANKLRAIDTKSNAINSWNPV
jgi:hypothetical protein